MKMEINCFFPDYLAIDPIRRRFYVSDRSETILQAQYDNMEISKRMNTLYPNGITVDEDGLVYVCVKGTMLISAFDFNSGSTNDLIKNDRSTWNQQSICFNELDSNLYVGQYNSDFMKVYKIEKKKFVKCKVLERVEKWLPV